MSLPIYHTVDSAMASLIGYIAQELSITVIEHGQPNAQVGRPVQTYATVLAVRGRDLAMPHQRVGGVLGTPEGDQNERTHALHITCMHEHDFEVRFYGDDGPDKAELLPKTRHRVTGRDYLQTAGIQFRPLGDQVDTRELRSTTHEPTSLLELGVLYATEDEASTGTIETVRSNVHDGSTDVDYDVTVT